MSKQRQYQWIYAVVGLILIIALLPLNLKTILPTGQVIAPLTAVFAFAGLSVLPWWSALLMLILGEGSLILLNAGSLFDLVALIVVFLIVQWLIDWQPNQRQTFTGSQLITIGLVVGITMIVVLLIGQWIIGAVTMGHRYSLDIVRLAFPTALLTGLTNVLVVPLLVGLLNRLKKRYLPAPEKEQTKGSVVIDLSQHDDQKKPKSK